MKKILNIPFVAALVMIVLAGSLTLWQISSDDDEANTNTAPTITNFDECVAAGNPVMESFPEQCRTEDGQLFINDVTIDDQTLEDVTPSTDTTQ